MSSDSPRKRRRDSRDDPLTPTPSTEVENDPGSLGTDNMAGSYLPLESSKDSPYRSRRLSGSSDSTASSYHTANDSSPEPTLATLEHKEEVPILPSTGDKMLQCVKAVVQENTKKLEGKIDTLNSRMEKVETDIQLIQSKMPHSEEVGSESSPDQLTGSLPLVAEVEEKCAAGKSAQQQLVSRKQCTLLSSSNMIAKEKEPLAQKQHSRVQLPQKPCDTKTLLWLRTKVTSWKFIARQLGLDEADISTIEKDNPNDSQEQCYKMFMKWKSLYSENDSYQVLGNALREEDPGLFKEFVKKVYTLT